MGVHAVQVYVSVPNERRGHLKPGAPSPFPPPSPTHTIWEWRPAFHQCVHSLDAGRGWVTLAVRPLVSALLCTVLSPPVDLPGGHNWRLPFVAVVMALLSRSSALGTPAAESGACGRPASTRSMTPFVLFAALPFEDALTPVALLATELARRGSARRVVLAVPEEAGSALPGRLTGLLRTAAESGVDVERMPLPAGTLFAASWAAGVSRVWAAACGSRVCVCVCVCVCVGGGGGGGVAPPGAQI
jgi:hypothetical protein